MLPPPPIPLKLRTLVRGASAPQDTTVLRVTDTDADADTDAYDPLFTMNPIPPPPPMLTLRAASSGMTQSLLSEAFDYSGVDSFSRFEQMRALALGADQDNPDPELIIAPISEPRDLTDRSVMISGNGMIFITGTTQKTISYNDLVVKRWTKLENDTYEESGFLNYDNNHCEWLEHSGDNVVNNYIGGAITKLQHGILINTPESHRLDIQFVNQNIEGADITSIRGCQPMHDAFESKLAQIVESFDDVKPIEIMICAQITFNQQYTLRDLSPVMAPSCGIIINNTIHACDWTDDTNMTCWANIFVYQE